MIAGETDVSIKDQPTLNAFVERASGRLAGIRKGILIFDQDRDSHGDIDISIRNLQLLRRDAAENERLDIVELADRCEASLSSLLASVPSPSDIGRSLDLVARIEESIFKIPLGADDFLNDISGFVDRSFESFTNENSTDAMVSAEPDEEDFELDEETLEIFRSEATELLHNIAENVRRLNAASGDREALWEVRRNAHTFKGAAGIVGLKSASELAHRVEDLLDKMVESNAVVETEIVHLLARSTKRLEVITLGTDFDEEAGTIDALYAEFGRVIAAVPVKRAAAQSSTATVLSGKSQSVEGGDPVKSAAMPIVRVSLDRLDELIRISRNLTINRSALVECFARLPSNEFGAEAREIFEKLESLFDAQRHLTAEMHEKLSRVRMVRFGALESRLGRAVHITCQEENKKAGIVLENGECEVDTQVIDAMIEPLLHLLKNAVVHGIETSETRRLIGKPEKGDIRIRVDSDESGVTLVVADDGRGISPSKLKQKALSDGLLSPELIEKMTETEAFELIFHRGLTTADKLNLNAGRGVGMSIVKDSIESHGGSIAIASEPQKGTIFTLRMPLTIKKAEVRDRSQKLSVDEIKPVEAAAKLVLIVDDSASIRRQTSRLVEAAGHRSITAVNGAEAMELLLSNIWRPDLILSDVEMPMMDGWEFLECLKNTDQLCDIPVIMVTSLDTDEYRERAFELGASDYIVKPLNTDSLAEKTVHLLKRS